jgi:4'-phosphopantetheinyl transferase
MPRTLREALVSEPLGPQPIELWCASLADIDAAQCWESYRALLDGPERARQQRLRMSDDRRRDLAARALVRTVLSRHAPVAPEAWEFAPDAHGRPRILAPQPVPPLEFNIAHSGELVVLAVRRAGALGVDVECLERRTDTVALERYFAPEEAEALRALPPGERRRRFFELWTLKESYLKARGVGLRLPLRGFAFGFTAPGTLELTFTGLFADDPAQWAFAQFALGERYVLAVCAQRRASQALALKMHAVVPLVWQRPLSATLERTAGMSVALGG